MTARDIPSEIRRKVRQEANFGCAACGCPLIDYHHIEPFHKVNEHTFRNIVALCPTCHRRANEGGAWSKDYVLSKKNNPYNTSNAKDKFATDNENYIVKLGMWEFHTLGNLIALDELIVLSCIKNNDGIIVISGIFHDAHGNLIATIVENEWNVVTDKVWDIEYTSGSRLIIKKGKRNIILKMNITTDYLEIQQCFFMKDNLKVKLFGSTAKSKMLVEASGGTRFRSENEKVIFNAPLQSQGGAAITLK